MSAWELRQVRVPQLSVKQKSVMNENNNYLIIKFLEFKFDSFIPVL